MQKNSELWYNGTISVVTAEWMSIHHCVYYVRLLKLQEKFRIAWTWLRKETDRNPCHIDCQHELCSPVRNAVLHTIDVLRYVIPSHTRVCPKVSGLSHNEIYAYNNKHSLRSNTKCYGGKAH
jgi:hypothetical protein